MTLGRTIWFFIKLGLVVAAAIWLADRPGRVSIIWLGYNIDLAVGTAMAALVILILLLYVVWRVWHMVRRAPGGFALFRRSRRQAKGFKALTRGLVAAAAGDAAEAKRLARTAHGLLDRSPLTLLLAAQAAQLEGDEHAAGRYFEALSKNPEAALLGLRGLTTAALKRGDETAALAHAEAALQSHPHAEWAAETAHRLQVKLGKPAEESLKALVRAGAMSAKQGQHRRAVLLAERARQALLPETRDADLDAALRAAREALKLDSGFVPARLILVHLLLRMGKKREATRLIEQDWDSNPHPLLARAYIEAEPGERAADRMKRLERLARQNPDHIETHRALGQTAVIAGLWGDARRHLERLIAAERATGGLSHATCRAMAVLEEGEHRDTAAARRWLAEGAQALPDPAWICSACGHPGEAGPASGHWQAVCPHCAAIDSYRWQRPVLPSGDILMGPPDTVTETAPETPVAAEPAPIPAPASAAAAETPAPARESAPSPAASPAEKKLETQLAPSVDAARSIY
ncbi:MAG TPA: heme biosynthesis HemY N-terminal domain-containing protein [Candidatus Binatia bacterium]|nr:heme biosynthesis HemY N-terminal domain-containing protein [Candidatus Binatia bacterium]